MAIIIFVIICVVFIVVPPLNATPVRIIVGFPMVLFLPGYSLICTLFPKKMSQIRIERIVLSILLSSAGVVIIGWALNYTSWGIRLDPNFGPGPQKLLLSRQFAPKTRKGDQKSIKWDMQKMCNG